MIAGTHTVEKKWLSQVVNWLLHEQYAAWMWKCGERKRERDREECTIKEIKCNLKTYKMPTEFYVTQHILLNIL